MQYLRQVLDRVGQHDPVPLQQAQLAHLQPLRQRQRADGAPCLRLWFRLLAPAPPDATVITRGAGADAEFPRDGRALRVPLPVQVLVHPRPYRRLPVVPRLGQWRVQLRRQVRAHLPGERAGRGVQQRGDVVPGRALAAEVSHLGYELLVRQVAPVLQVLVPLLLFTPVPVAKLQCLFFRSSRSQSRPNLVHKPARYIWGIA